jgi:hypothetical protein
MAGVVHGARCTARCACRLLNARDGHVGHARAVLAVLHNVLGAHHREARAAHPAILLGLCEARGHGGESACSDASRRQGASARTSKSTSATRPARARRPHQRPSRRSAACQRAPTVSEEEEAERAVSLGGLLDVEQVQRALHAGGGGEHRVQRGLPADRRGQTVAAAAWSDGSALVMARGMRARPRLPGNGTSGM